MTIQEMIEKRLHESGLWPDEIKIIMDETKPKMSSMTPARWADLVNDGYPPEFYVTLWKSVARFAVDWIDKNKPMHFARHLLNQQRKIP